MHDPALVDSIYEAAFAPELWPGVLDRIAQIAQARGGLMFLGHGRVDKWTASASLAERMAFFAESGLLSVSQRQTRLFAARHSGFVTDHDLYSDEELETDPMYRDFLRPAGLGWARGMGITLPDGDRLSVSFERDYAKGPAPPEIVRKLDSLRPHIARSAFLALRQQLERARAVSDALAMLGLPAIVMDKAGKVLAANRLMDALPEHVRWRPADRFSLKDRGADGLLRQAVAAIDDRARTAVGSFVVRDADLRPASIAHILPLRGSARDLFAHSSAILVMAPVTMPEGPPVELIQSLFDLSAAEARIARGLAGGWTLETIAASGGVSKETARTQLRGVLEKTGCRRQAEVVALLNGPALRP